MDYIYSGELQIFQEDLDRFLNVAQRLKIEGLMTDPNDIKGKEVKNLQTEHLGLENTAQQIIPTYQEEPEQNVIEKVNTTINSDNSSELNERIQENIVRNIDNTWGCKVCSRCFARRVTLILHIETHLEGLSFDCPLCEKTFRSRNQLAIHKYRNHKCPQK